MDLEKALLRKVGEAIQRFKTELMLLSQIQARSSWDSYVKDDIGATQSQILAGNDKTPPELTGYVIPAAATSGGLILLVIIVWTALAITGRRRKPVPVAALAEEDLLDVGMTGEAPAMEASPAEVPEPSLPQV